VFLSDYFNYMSTFSSVVFLTALLILIPLGLLLCRFKLKFILISILGLIFTTVYFSQLTMLVVNYLKVSNHNIIAVFLEDGLPVAFFLVAGLGTIRSGVQIWVNHWQYRPLPTPTVRVTLKKRLWSWRDRFLVWIKTPEGIGVCAIETVILSIHLIFINQPVTSSLIDEGYYVPETLRFLHGRLMNLPQHPPLGKWLIASGILVFGNNPVGWRIMSVIFSLIGILLFYLIVKKLTAKWPLSSPFVPLLAVFLLATENLSFVIGHVAMLDVFYVTFMLVGFLFYLRGNYLSCGVAMGLSLLCKLTALLGIAAVVLYWLITNRREIVLELRNIWDAVNDRVMKFPLSNNILNIFKLMVVMAGVWIVLIVPLEYGSAHQFTSNTLWYNPFFRAVYMVWHPLIESSASLSAGALGNGKLYGVRSAIQWILSPSALNVNLATGPKLTRYLGSIGWNIWVLIIPSFLYLIYASVNIREKGHEIALFLSCWLVGVYGALVVIQLMTGRLMYDYYFYPAVPVICLTIAWGAWRLWELVRNRTITRVLFITGLSLYLLTSLAVFVIMSPLGTRLIKLP
jgi:Dolichyl-phosphate-mannose-protein mannosyltransferase